MTITNEYEETKLKRFEESMNLLLSRSVGVRVTTSYEKQFDSVGDLLHLVNVHFGPAGDHTGMGRLVVSLPVYSTSPIDDSRLLRLDCTFYLYGMLQNAYCLFWLREMLRKLEDRGLIRAYPVLIRGGRQWNFDGFPGFRIEFLRYGLDPVYVGVPFFEDHHIFFVRYLNPYRGYPELPGMVGQEPLCKAQVKDGSLAMRTYYILSTAVKMSDGEYVFGFSSVVLCAATYCFLGACAKDPENPREDEFRTVCEVAEEFVGIRVPKFGKGSVKKLREAIRGCDLRILEQKG